MRGKSPAQIVLTIVNQQSLVGDHYPVRLGQSLANQNAPIFPKDVKFGPKVRQIRPIVLRLSILGLFSLLDSSQLKRSYWWLRVCDRRFIPLADREGTVDCGPRTLTRLMGRQGDTTDWWCPGRKEVRWMRQVQKDRTEKALPRKHQPIVALLAFLAAWNSTMSRMRTRTGLMILSVKWSPVSNCTIHF